MSKFLETINIFKKTKRYFILKQLEKNKEELNKTYMLIIINVLITTFILTGLFWDFFINKNEKLKVVGIAVVFIYTVAFIVYLIISSRKGKKTVKGIKIIALLDDSDVKIKEWNIYGKTSVIIGKNTKNMNVDIDLSDTDHATSISRMHAVMNFAEDNWYVEDLGSSNGIGIKKANDNKTKRLHEDTSCRVEHGDIIYIANAKLLVI